MSRDTTARVAAGRTWTKISLWTALTAGESSGSTRYIRVRTTSSSVKPACASAPSTIANAARACAAASPGCIDRPSRLASVVPAT